MNKIMQNKLFRVDKFTLAIMICVLIAIGIIIGVWWYYDCEIDQMKHDLDKSSIQTISEY